MSRSRRATLLPPVAAFAVPALAGLLLGQVGESTVVGALTLLIEPLLLAVAVYIALVLIAGRKWAEAAGLLAGTLLAGQLLRLSPEPQPVASVRPEWAERLRPCTTQPDPVNGPIRILLWTVERRRPLPASPDDLVASQPDIVVLHGVNGPELGESMAGLLEGESMFLPGEEAGAGISLVARGLFQYCGGHKDRWEMALPSAEGHEARLVVAFPEIRDAGVVPLMVVRLDAPGRLVDWVTWNQRLLDGSRMVAAIARTINPHRMVVAGNFEAPRTFRRLAGQLLGAGLSEANVPASWPARLGPLPTPTLHALDRVWMGESWEVSKATSLIVRDQPRRPILVDLSPREARARAR